MRSHPLDYNGVGRLDRFSHHRVMLPPLEGYHPQVAISRQALAAASWPQQSVGRTADAAPTAFRVWM